MFKKFTLLCCLLTLCCLSSNDAFARFRNRCCDPCDPCCDSTPKREVVRKEIKKVAPKEVVIEQTEQPVVQQTERVIEQEQGIVSTETVTKTETKEQNYYPGLW